MNAKPAFLITTAILAATAMASQAFEPTYLPGGEDVKAAVAARRGQTELSKLALSMEPGTWAELKTERLGGMWSAPRIPNPDGGRGRGGLHIGTWSDDAHWCSRTGQFLFFGVRQTRKFVAYSEVSNAWRVIEFLNLTNAPGLEQRFGHQYSGNAFDPERSHFYTNGRRYDVQANTWEIHPAWRRAARERSMTISWSAMDGLFVLISQPAGVLRLLPYGADAWRDVGKISCHGYHSVARHNPFRQEVLFTGGNNSRAVAIVDKDGTARAVKPFPAPVITIRQSAVTVDPISGRYLMMGHSREFYEFDSATNRYRLLDDPEKSALPFDRRDSPMVAFIPEYGVSMWADRSVFLYKHNPDGDYPVVEPDPEKQKGDEE